MRILLLTQLFQPEPAHLKGVSFARELLRRGHQVDVVTGFPHYPGGALYPGYQLRWRMREELEGVSVVRLPLFPSHDLSGLRRFATYASFAASASVLGPLLVKRPDVVHVYQGPATLALPAMVFRLLRGVPYLLDVQDIWPESVTSSNMLRRSWALPPIAKWSDLACRRAAVVVVVSEGYRRALVARGIPAEKIRVIYNWCDESNLLRRGQGRILAESGLADTFNIVFAGTVGPIQALDAVVRAAELIRNDLPQVRFVVVGDGIDLERIKRLIAQLQLPNVVVLPRQPPDEIGQILGDADALLVHLKDDPLTRISIPQKTYAYMAIGRPVIMAVRGDAADLLVKAGAGVVCEPDDPASIAEAVRRLLLMPENERRSLGENGKKFYQENLSFRRGVEEVETALTMAAGGEPSAPTSA